MIDTQIIFVKILILHPIVRYKGLFRKDLDFVPPPYSWTNMTGKKWIIQHN